MSDDGLDDWEKDIENEKTVDPLEKLKKEEEKIKEKKEEKRKEKEEIKEKRNEKVAKKFVAKVEETKETKKPVTKTLAMFDRYNKTLSEKASVEEVYGDHMDADQIIHIELLEPKTITEFSEYARIIGLSVSRFSDEKAYKDFIYELIERCCESFDKKDVQVLVKKLGGMIDAREEKRRIAKKERAEINMGVGSGKGEKDSSTKLLEKTFVDDEDGGNDSDYDKDNDFM